MKKRKHFACRKYAGRNYAVASKEIATRESVGSVSKIWDRSYPVAVKVIGFLTLIVEIYKILH